MNTKARFKRTPRTMLRAGAVWIGGTLGMCGAAHAVDCSNLISIISDSSTMTAAASVTPPATISGVAVTVPMCRVQGTARPSSDSEIKFEVWLPATADD